jgi:hypothetical protein
MDNISFLSFPQTRNGVKLMKVENSSKTEVVQEKSNNILKEFARNATQERERPENVQKRDAFCAAGSQHEMKHNTNFIDDARLQINAFVNRQGLYEWNNNAFSGNCHYQGSPYNRGPGIDVDSGR